MQPDAENGNLDGETSKESAVVDAVLMGNDLAERANAENVADAEGNSNAEPSGKFQIKGKGNDLVGKFVQKSFGSFGLFLGKVTEYFPSEGFYQVRYEDGDLEDLELHELEGILIDERDFRGDWLDRKRRLEDSIVPISRKRGRPPMSAKGSKALRKGKNEDEKGTDGPKRKRRKNETKENRFLGNERDPDRCKDTRSSEPTSVVVDGFFTPKVSQGTKTKVLRKEKETKEDAKNSDSIPTVVCALPTGGKATLDGKGRKSSVSKKAETWGERAKEAQNIEAGAEENTDNTNLNLRDTKTSQECVEENTCLDTHQNNAQSKEIQDTKNQGEETAKGMSLCTRMEDINDNPADIVFSDFQKKKTRGRPRKNRDDDITTRQPKTALQSAKTTENQNLYNKTLTNNNVEKQDTIFTDADGSVGVKPTSGGRRRRKQRASATAANYIENEEAEEDSKKSAVSSCRRSQRKRGMKSSSEHSEYDPDNDSDLDNTYEGRSHSHEEFNSLESDISPTEGSCQIARFQEDVDVPLPPLLPLPPSSGDLDVPEDSVPALFCTYSFLRTFSDLLFLSPFSLQDFMAALNYKSVNSLMDCVHVALLRALRRHLEKLSKEGNEQALKCLKHLDWNFLDVVTWPSYLVEYLLTQGFAKSKNGKSALLEILADDYYGISSATKLLILQHLCDDVLETEEAQTVINMRLEVEQDVDTEVIKSSISVSRVNNKNSCSKRKRISCSSEAERNALTNQNIGESTGSGFHSDNTARFKKLGMIKNKQVEMTDSTGGTLEDPNIDECRLCGMDGRLICCDGCPSAYHSRCVGLTKALLPEGAWYCPECVVEKSNPTDFKTSKPYVGAQTFGIDPHNRLFLGTCGYLLVVDSDQKCCSYNRADLHKVLEVLETSGNIYNDIKNSIISFWSIPKSFETGHSTKNLDAVSIVSPVPLRSNSSYRGQQEDGFPRHMSSGPETKAEQDIFNHDRSLLPSEDTSALKPNELPCAHESLGGVVEAVQESMESVPRGYTGQSLLGSCVSNSKQSEIDTGKAIMHVGSNPVTEGLLQGNVDIGKAIVPAKNNQAIEELPQGNFDIGKTVVPAEDNLIREGLSQGNVDNDFNIQVEEKTLPHVAVDLKNRGSGEAFEKREAGGNDPDRKEVFKPDSYVNHYVLGDSVASAAATLISLSTEDRLVNSRSALKKTLAATMAMQQKAFSQMPLQFVWPSFKKKIAEQLLKERCGWCASCTSNVSCRRACLLSVATNDAMIGAAKVCNGLRPTKSGIGHLSSVASYVLFMEEVLRGLFFGEFANSEYRKVWRKHLEQASTVREVRSCLLKLEQCIRQIALSPDWFKHVDNWNIGLNSSTKPSHKGNTSILHLRRRTSHALWWRGGPISSQVFHWCALPHSVSRKAGRQGGRKRIKGVLYSEDDDICKRSRQHAWRVAVEKARTVSQLAVQLRYLDAYILWKDIGYPESLLHDGKQVEKEVSAFKSAVVCDKKVTGDETRYLLHFSDILSIPETVIRKGVRAEVPVGMQYWLREFDTPLYVLKILEEKTPQSFPTRMPRSFCKNLNVIKKVTGIGNIFDIILKRTETGKIMPCAVCEEDIFKRKPLKCSDCEGICHIECISNYNLVSGCNSDLTCLKCSQLKLSHERNNLKMTPRKQIYSSHQKQSRSSGQNLNIADYRMIRPTPLSSVVDRDTMSSQKKRISMSCSQNGLIWKKNGYDKAMAQLFIESKVRLPHTQSMGNEESPFCLICHQPYDPNLTYIGCVFCKEWFHADAFGLEQERIVDLVGLKCHRCRKKGAPHCPYSKDKTTKDRSVRRAKLPTKRLGSKVKQMPTANPDQIHSFDMGYDNYMHASEDTPAQQEIIPVDSTPFFNDFGTQNQHPNGPEFFVSAEGRDDSLEEMYAEHFNENEPLFSFQELLAADDNQVELADQPQINLQNWANTQNDNYIGTEASQNGPMVSSYMGEEIGFDIGREVTQTPYACFKTDGTDGTFNEFIGANNEPVNPFPMGLEVPGEVNKVETSNMQYFSPESSVKMEHTGTHCILCLTISKPVDCQCKICGIGIHYDCYSVRPTGMFGLCGWTCASCSAGSQDIR